MLTHTMLSLWQDDLGRLRKTHRHGDGHGPGSTAVHLRGTEAPVPRAAAATPLNCLADGGATRETTELQGSSNRAPAVLSMKWEALVIPMSAICFSGSSVVMVVMVVIPEKCR